MNKYSVMIANGGIILLFRCNIHGDFMPSGDLNGLSAYITELNSIHDAQCKESVSNYD